MIEISIIYLLSLSYDDDNKDKHGDNYKDGSHSNDDDDDDDDENATYWYIEKYNSSHISIRFIMKWIKHTFDTFQIHVKQLNLILVMRRFLP